MGVDAVVAKVQQLSAEPGEWAQLATYLDGEGRTIERQTAHAAEALQALDPAAHSLGYLHLLNAAGGASPADTPFFEHSARFLLAAEPRQLALAPKKLASLCHKLKEQAVLLERPKAAIRPLLAALGILAPSPDYITPVHAHLFQVCLLAKCYSAAAAALHEDACEVDPSVTALTATDFLLYCYYGARVHIGRRRYEAALQLLLQALTAPTMVVNAITVAAYKKYALVALIHLGHVPPLPKYAATSVARIPKADCGRYVELAKAFGKPGGSFQAAAAKHADALAADGNGGLLQLAAGGRVKRAIQRLTQTYLTLSLASIAQTAGLASAGEAEATLLRMIDGGEIWAEIDGPGGMVRFQEDPEAFDSPAAAARLDAAIGRAMRLAARVQALKDTVSCDKALFSKLEGKERPGGGLGADSDLGPEAGFLNL